MESNALILLPRLGLTMCVGQCHSVLIGYHSGRQLMRSVFRSARSTGCAPGACSCLVFTGTGA